MSLHPMISLCSHTKNQALLLIGLMLALPSCSLLSNVQPDPVTVHAVQTEIPEPPKPDLPLPAPVNQVPIEWVVISSNEFQCTGDFVFMAMTPGNYEDLSRNQADLLRWIEEASYQLDYYRERE